MESGLNEIHCRALSALLGYSVGTVLWPHYEARILARDSHTELTTRVGRGRATYHRADRSSRHLIVFGWKMVQQKSLGWPAASRWTSGREIVNRGYYSGHVDLLSVLAMPPATSLRICCSRSRASASAALFIMRLSILFSTRCIEKVSQMRCLHCWSSSAEMWTLMWGGRKAWRIQAPCRGGSGKPSSSPGASAEARETES